MKVALYHNYYSKQHLAEVSKEMETLGSPSIRAIWSEAYGMWMAVEGCHRLRAAAELGLTPEIIDISDAETVVVQNDGEDEAMDVQTLAAELTEQAYRITVLEF